MRTKTIQSLLPAALLALAASCTDLDVDILSQYTAFPESELAAEAKAANAYFAMRGPLGCDYNNAQTLSSDEATSFSFNSTDYWDNGYRNHITLHSWTPDDSAISYWGSLTQGITTCNGLIAEMGGNEAAVTAPIRAVRAYYFWVLMDSYGDVPLLDHVPAEDEAIDRAPRADIARFIESELLAVVNLLPDNVDVSTYGKPTRWMADALLAKLYLNWAVYTCGDVTAYSPETANPKLNNLVSVCDDIITSGKFDLTDNYLTKFTPENGPHIKDFIYAMPYDRETQQGMTYARFWTHRNGNKDFYGVDLPNSVGGCLALNPGFIDKFNLPGDDRNEQILGGPLFVRSPSTYKATATPWIVSGQQVTLTKEITLNSLDETMPVDNTAHGGRSQGYRSIKFYMDLKTTASQNRSQSNDAPIFRYADILLMKAEAILRGATATNGDTPMSLVNQIRDYVHAPQITQSPTLDELLDERAREFADENWRRNDLIRFGKFEDDWGYKHIINPNARTERYRRIFPVPRSILNTNTNWSQNNGY
ncbi:MAG: RagB/SusD family nutrient uptake outer membrane protein [Mediterranea sp.]|nr:RagB/SusD family nutrient uptake outer membrane protein [Mediterranea sp.]